MKFGLRNMKILLESVGHPERAFPSVHIAGTNGKGSTASFLSSIAIEAGCKTGLYTSPHLIRFTERIRINGVEMPEPRLVEYTNRLRPTIESVQATFFEATTCVAFLYFAEESVDIAVVETGLGGRLDATNTLTPLLSIITNVSYDHIEQLGRTLRGIAREKGGIIKRGVPCLTGSSNADVHSVLSRIARRRRSRLLKSSKITKVHIQGEGKTGSPIRFSATGLGGLKTEIGLRGNYQARNAELAVSASSILRRLPQARELFGSVTPEAIARGLRNVQANSGLRCRFETIEAPERYILDVAHNPDAVRNLVTALEPEHSGPYVVIFGVMRDKDYGSMLEELRKVALVIVPVIPKTQRALGMRALARAIRQTGNRMERGGTVRQGLRTAGRIASGGLCILVTGSHYVVGEALAILSKRKIA